MLNKLIISSAITIVAISVYCWIVRRVFRLLERKKRSINLRFIRSFVLILGLTVIIYSFLCQFEGTRVLSQTLVQGGSLIIALATFSCQQVLGNVVSGIVISAIKPFEIGDKITLQSGSTQIITGVVKDMNIRHVSIETADGKVATVNNSLVDSYVCINENTLANNGFPFAIECSFDSDVNLAIKLMQQEIYKHPLTITESLEDVNITCSSITANGFELKTIIFTKDVASNFKACSDLRLGIFKIWQSNGIKIPYQTNTIFMG